MITSLHSRPESLQCRKSLFLAFPSDNFTFVKCSCLDKPLPSSSFTSCITFSWKVRSILTVLFCKLPVCIKVSSSSRTFDIFFGTFSVLKDFASGCANLFFTTKYQLLGKNRSKFHSSMRLATIYPNAQAHTNAKTLASLHVSFIKNHLLIYP